MADDPALYLDATRILAPSACYVQAEAFIRRVKDRLAREAFSADSTDEETTARTIVRWVHQTLRPGSIAIGKFGVAPTLEAILSKRLHSCGEYAVLTCFLLRCHQIPARLIWEKLHTAFRLPASLLALLPSAWAGPYLQGHVWVELYADGRWRPADAELDIFDVPQWLDKRLRQAHRVKAGFLGLSTSSTGSFPSSFRPSTTEASPPPSSRVTT